MNKKIMLEQMSDIIHRHRDKPLLNSEYLILKGCLNNRKYSEISDMIKYEKNYCTLIGGKLFKCLSEHFNVKVTKTNFIWFCETYLSDVKVNFS